MFITVQLSVKQQKMLFSLTIISFAISLNLPFGAQIFLRLISCDASCVAAVLTELIENFILSPPFSFTANRFVLKAIFSGIINLRCVLLFKMQLMMQCEDELNSIISFAVAAQSLAAREELISVRNVIYYSFNTVLLKHTNNSISIVNVTLNREKRRGADEMSGK